MPPSSRPRRHACAALLATLVATGCGSEPPRLTQDDASRLADGIAQVRSAAADGRLRAAITASTRLRASFGELEGRGVFAEDERRALRAELRRLDDALGHRRERARARARVAAARKRALEEQREAEALAAAQAAAAQQAAQAQAAAEQEAKDDKKERRDGSDRRSRDDAELDEEETGGAQWDRDDRGRGKRDKDDSWRGGGDEGRAPGGRGGDSKDDDDE
jgi:hypothetical protein